MYRDYSARLGDTLPLTRKKISINNPDNISLNWFGPHMSNFPTTTGRVLTYYDLSAQLAADKFRQATPAYYSWALPLDNSRVCTVPQTSKRLDHLPRYRPLLRHSRTILSYTLATAPTYLLQQKKQSNPVFHSLLFNTNITKHSFSLRRKTGIFSSDSE